MMIRKSAGLVFFGLLFVIPMVVSGGISDQNTTITLERGMCYGTCPVYTLTISGNGTVIYDGQMYVKEIGVRTGVINASSFSLLMDRFASAGFFTLQDAYTRYDVTDMPSAIITVQDGNQTKRVEHYYGDRDAPPVLMELEQAVDEAGNVTSWTTPYEEQSTKGEVI